MYLHGAQDVSVLLRLVATLGLSQPLGQYVLEYAILVLTLSITGDIKNGSSPQASFF